ncbi:MAG: AI-2E family transporter, partial [Candidatus Omnitrophica bacterium]|nr:AI-2E family transporter [Candidatus Omnitrophota bacterium]
MKFATLEKAAILYTHPKCLKYSTTVTDQPVRSQGFNVMLTLAAFVVVVAGMKAATSILIPFLLSVFIAIVSSPALFGMKKRGVPTPIALLIVMLVVILVGVLVIALVGNSITDFTSSLPEYQKRLQGEGARLFDWFDQWLRRIADLVPGQQEVPEGDASVAVIAEGAMESPTPETV